MPISPSAGSDGDAARFVFRQHPSRGGEFHVSLGELPKPVPDPLVFTHSYPEIHLGVQMALEAVASDDAAGIARIVREAQGRMRRYGIG